MNYSLQGRDRKWKRRYKDGKCVHEKILGIFSFREEMLLESTTHLLEKLKKKKKINEAWKQQVLARMWLIWSPHPGKYTTEQSCWKVVPHEPATPPLDIYPSKRKTYFHTKPIWKGTWLLHSWSSKTRNNHNIFKLGMDKQAVVHSHKGILFNNLKESDIDTRNNLNVSKMHSAKWLHTE